MVIFCGFLMICVSWGRLVFVLLINGFFWDVFNKEVLDVFRNFKKKKIIIILNIIKTTISKHFTSYS